jgi:hypothetical protein
MTELTLDETRDSFLCREPVGFFDDFEGKRDLAESLLEPLLALRANLQSAIMVGAIPFQLAYSAVLDKRFSQLSIAARIHELRVGPAPQSEDENNERDRTAHENAKKEMDLELRDPEAITRHAWSTVNVLKGHLQRDDFRMSAQELLRQIVVMCWSAFEIVASDSLRVVMNRKPMVFGTIAEARPYREVFSSRVLIETMKANGFDLSTKMGDVFCNEVRIDSLQKIRDIYRFILSYSSVDIILGNELLWRIFQQRNLIVHRRGLIDVRYLETTSDSGTIGAYIVFNTPYVEASLNMVRDAGLAIIEGCHRKLNSTA